MANKPTTKPTKLKPHPLGSMFPPMGDEEYKRLVQGIKTNGYDPKEPVILFQGMILDGNHRFTACEKLKIKAPTEEFKGSEQDAFQFVIQKNLSRRNLTPSQSAALGAEIVEKMKAAEKAAAAELKAAEKAAKAAGKPAPKPVRPKGDKTETAAKAVNASPRSVAKAVALKKSDPEAFKAVQAGAVTLETATKQTDKKKSAKEKESDGYAEALARIEKANASLNMVTMNRLKAKDIIRYSELEPDRMRITRGFLHAGNTLSAALSYKMVDLVPGHKIRDLIERAIAQGSTYQVEILDYVVTVTKKD